jgi:hypothetical protein
MSETINLHLTLEIERNGDVGYIRRAVVNGNQSHKYAALRCLVQRVVNHELAGQDLPVEDGQ